MKRKRTSLTGIIFTAALALGLAACGSAEDFAVEGVLENDAQELRSSRLFCDRPFGEVAGLGDYATNEFDEMEKPGYLSPAQTLPQYAVGIAGDGTLGMSFRPIGDLGRDRCGPIPDNGERIYVDRNLDGSFDGFFQLPPRDLGSLTIYPSVKSSGDAGLWYVFSGDNYAYASLQLITD